MAKDVASVITDQQRYQSRIGPVRFYGVPRKLKCAGCQVGDHCNGDSDDCYCECTEARPSV